jgi:hypothetical protein
VEVCQVIDVTVVTTVGVSIPPTIHAGRIRVVKCVVAVNRPLHVDPPRVSRSKAIAQSELKRLWIQEIIKSGRGEWFISGNSLTDCQ